MKELGLTQQYLLCALNKSGRLPVFGQEKILCLCVAGVLELLLADVLVLDGKRLTVAAALPAEKNYLRPVYSWIEKKQPVKFTSVAEHFTFTFTDTNIRGLINAVGDSLADAGCVKKEKGSILGGKELYLANEEDVDAVVQCVRAELLEEGELSEDMVALTVLLNKSGELARYFSAYEKGALKKRLKEIRKAPQSEMVRKAAEYIDSLFLMTILASA